MSLTTTAKYALLSDIAFTHDPKKHEIVIDTSHEAIHGAGFESGSQHHEAVLKAKVEGGAVVTKSTSTEIRLANRKER